MCGDSFSKTMGSLFLGWAVVLSESVPAGPATAANLTRKCPVLFSRDPPRPWTFTLLYSSQNLILSFFVKF